MCPVPHTVWRTYEVCLWEVSDLVSSSYCELKVRVYKLWPFAGISCDVSSSPFLVFSVCLQACGHQGQATGVAAQLRLSNSPVVVWAGRSPPDWLLWQVEELFFRSLSFICSVCICHSQPNILSLYRTSTLYLSPSHFLSVPTLHPAPFRALQGTRSHSTNPTVIPLTLFLSPNSFSSSLFSLQQTLLPPSSCCSLAFHFICSHRQPSPDCPPGAITTPYSSLSPLSKLIIHQDIRIRLSPSQNLSVNCPACGPKRKVNTPGYWCIMHGFLQCVLLDALL